MWAKIFKKYVVVWLPPAKGYCYMYLLYIQFSVFRNGQSVRPLLRSTMRICDCIFTLNVTIQRILVRSALTLLIDWVWKILINARRLQYIVQRLILSRHAGTYFGNEKSSQDLADLRRFNILIPSRRRIEFLQKNITQLNVEFKQRNVLDHMLNKMAFLSFREVLDVKPQIEYISCGVEQKKKQPTAKKHVEIFLKLILRSLLFWWLDVEDSDEALVSSLYFDLAMTNTL